MEIKEIAAIILAAGKGERMRSELPKVLHPVMGKPMIKYVIDSLKSAQIKDIYAVVGYKGEQVINSVGDGIKYVWQHEQLGTGHAVMQAEDTLDGFSGNLLIACGDVPFIKPKTFKRLIDESEKDNVKAVILTMELNDPTGYGRIIKAGSGDFLRIVEEKDASTEEKKVTEVNSGTYVFDKEFLFKGLKIVNRDNAQGEYYLPDALNFILEAGYSVRTVLLEDPFEGTGVNSQEDLKRVELIYKNKP